MRAQLIRSANLPHIRLYPWELEDIEGAAAIERVKLTEFVRAVLLDAARKVVRERGAEQ